MTMKSLYKVGDWIKYQETWTKELKTVIDEIDIVRSATNLTLYGTKRGYLVNDSMILERRGAS